MPKTVNISHRTVVFTALFALLLWFVFQIMDILVMFFISLIISTAMNPLVDRLQKLRVPRPIAILIVYILIWGILGTLIASTIPGLVDQTKRLISVLPAAVSRIELFSNHQQEIAQQFLARVGELPQNLLKIIISLFGNLINVLTVLVMAFYLLLERDKLDQLATPKAAHMVRDIENQLGNWIRGEVILMVAVGFLTYVGLQFLRIDSALPLAILAGFLEIVPNVGPIISSIPSILVALTIHPITAAATASLYFLVQFLENNLLVPKIMQQAVGVNPLVSLLGLMIGFRLGGPVGAILALPIIISARIIIREYLTPLPRVS